MSRKEDRRRSEETERTEKYRKHVTARELWKAAVFELTGYAAAIIGNALIPQVADIDTPVYPFFSFEIDRNGFYRLILALVMVIFLLGAVRAQFEPDRRALYVHKASFRFATGIALLLYDIAGTKLQITTQPFFPGPAQILESFLMEGRFIGSNTLYSLRLFGAGFLTGAVLGVGTGILIGWFPKVHYWVYPILKMTGIIPAVAWMPFALTLFPTPFSAAVFLIMICSWFPVASQTSFGIRTTEKVQFEAARSLGCSTAYLVWHVAVPHAMPQIFAGLTTACASSFTCLVLAEMMGQPGGLGYYINIAKVWSSYYKVFAAILVMAILFSLILAVLGAVQSYVLRWQKGTFK